MKYTNTPLPDAYRIGWHWWEDVSAHRTTKLLGNDPRWSRRRTSDRWHRTWQAEWNGCQRAVRAYTRLGVIRKAARRIDGGA